MEAIQCNCPTCKGKLVFDNESKTMYCPKCNKHFLIDEQSKINLDENNDNEKVRIDDENVNIESEQMVTEPKKSKKAWKIIFGILFFPIVILIAPFYLTWYMIKKDEKRFNKSKIALVSLSWIVWLFIMAAALIPSANRKIYLANEYNEVNVGDVLDLSYVIEPESNIDVEIAISDDSILEKQDGFYYKTVKEGDVSVALISNKKEYSSYNIKVNEVLMNSISFKSDKLEIELDETVIPNVEYEPSNATYPNWTFTSDDNDVLEVKDNKVVARKEGTTTLHVLSDNGLKDEVEVTVVPVVAESISITGKNKLQIGDSAKYSVSFNPTNVTYKEVTLSVDDEKIATIDNDGNLVAKKDGTVVIAAQETSNDKKTQKTITITPIQATSIEISAPYDSLYVGGGMKVSVNYTPDNVTYKTVEYSSSNESVATVNEYGYVSAISEGTAKITAKTDNGIKDVLTVEVLSKPVAKVSQANVSNGSTYATSSNSSGSGTLVWISSEGHKYHRKSSCSGMNNPWQVTIEEAQAQGRDACKKCY